MITQSGFTAVTTHPKRAEVDSALYSLCHATKEQYLAIFTFPSDWLPSKPGSSWGSYSPISFVNYYFQKTDKLTTKFTPPWGKRSTSHYAVKIVNCCENNIRLLLMVNDARKKKTSHKPNIIVSQPVTQRVTRSRDGCGGDYVNPKPSECKFSILFVYIT